MQIENKSRQVALIVSASLAGFMALLDSNIVNISLPYIAKSFNIPTGSVVQIVLVYMLMVVGTMIIFGKVADQYGVKRIFISGFAIFTVSSLMCGLSGNLPILVLFRAVQALGGSMLFSTAYSLIPKFIPKNRLGWAFGIFSPVVSLGLLVGNPLGGLITGLFNWHWIFLINVPVGIVAILVAMKSIPNDRPAKDGHNHSGGFDYLGSMLSFAGLALLVVCMNAGNKVGWTSPYILGGILLAFALLALFIFVENRVRNPILDLAILRNKNFALSLVAALTGFGLMAGSSVLLPFYLTYVMQIDVEHAGFILMTFAVVYSALSPMAGNLSDHLKKTTMTSFGMILAILACTFFILVIPTAQLWGVFILLSALGVSYAFFITPNNNLVMSIADPGKQSISASIFKLSTNLGQMTGVLFMEIVFVTAMPSGFHATKAALHTVTVLDLQKGFQWAYGAGAFMCLIALVVTMWVKESDKGTTALSEEPVSLL